MAKITKLPSMEIIDGFKGVIDFYVYRGQPCARSWPRSPGPTRAPGVEAQWPAFSFAGSYWRNLPTEIQEAYISMVKGTPLTGRDLFTKSFITSDAIHIIGV